MVPGDQVGDYVLVDCLGEGGQGVVWRARPQHADDIFVALKMLRPWAEQDTDSVRRLREDAKAIARMKHPNIIKVHFFGQDRGRWYFAMELMEGGTVARRLDHYRDDPRSSAVLIEKVARAIHHAHTRNPGILHLDLKPGNILLDADGEPRVTDFGLSARMESLGAILGSPATERPAETQSPRLPPPGEISVAMSSAGMVGTVPYMSPEMAQGRTADISTASDVYGLGAILYAMLTGRPPFKGRDDIETLELVDRRPAPSPPHAEPESRPRARSDLPEMPEDRSRAAVRLGQRAGRRPQAVAEARADPGTRAHGRQAHPLLAAEAPVLVGGRLPGAGPGMARRHRRLAARTGRGQPARGRAIGSRGGRQVRDDPAQP